jgi:enamine deaminase RidA (YjgF/YER057c/UK114 family)
VIAGQVGMRQDGTVPEDPLEQIDIAFENILRNLRAANMDVKDIIKIMYYFVGEIDAKGGNCLSKLQGIALQHAVVCPAWQVRCFESRLMPGHPVPD